MEANAKNNSVLSKIWKMISKQKAVIAIIVLLLIVLVSNNRALFYNQRNILGILRSAAIIEIVAFGVSVAVICGGCDLSCGGVLSLSGIIAIMLINSGLPIVIGILGALVCGALIGFVNGFLVVHQKTEPFIITLGMGMLLRVWHSSLRMRIPLPANRTHS